MRCGDGSELVPNRLLSVKRTPSRSGRFDGFGFGRMVVVGLWFMRPIGVSVEHRGGHRRPSEGRVGGDSDDSEVDR